MSGRLINGIKYIYINDCNDFKKNSLYDNLYFTLRDIFWNSNSADICMEANHYNGLLTGDIPFEERTNSFQYTNVLYQKDEVKKILHWLNRFKQNGWFEFNELEKDEEIIKEEYMLFIDWWKQFEELRVTLEEHYKNL